MQDFTGMFEKIANSVPMGALGDTLKSLAKNKATPRMNMSDLAKFPGSSSKPNPMQRIGNATGRLASLSSQAFKKVF